MSTTTEAPMPARPLTILAALAALLTLTVAAPTAHAARGMEVALQDDGVFSSQEYYSRERAFRQAKQLGVTRLRVNVPWVSVASSVRSRQKPGNVVYAFNQYDSLYLAAKAHRIKLQLTLTGPAPAWATRNRRIGPYKPNARHYAEFVRATVSHFRGLVDRYSIWNEPNYVGWLAPLSQGPKLYRSLYVAGYRAAKQADPSAKVLIAETSPYALRRRATAPLDFLRRVTCTNRRFSHRKRGCGTLRADGYAHHPYDFDHRPTYRYPGRFNATLRTLGNLTGALRRLARARALSTPSGRPLSVYLTEYGFMESGKHRISARRHASYLRQGFAMALRNRHVKQMLQYLLVEPTSRYAFFDTSIVSRRGKTSRAFRALSSWARSQARARRIARR
jgi:hypothetical protein